MQTCDTLDPGEMPGVSKGHNPKNNMKNLKEFLAWRGYDNPYSWARSFYKYTDCGPWVNFLIQEAPARDVDHPAVIAVFRRVRGKVKLMNPDEVSPDYLQLLSLDEKGLDRKERAWDHYCGLVATYVADEAKQARTKKTLEIVKQTPTELHLRQPARTQHIEAKIRGVYYEEARDLDVDKCVGIEFGSIVEGSDACSGPFVHMFPISKKAFNRDVAFMEKETAFYWERDNGSWYTVRTDQDEWVVVNAWGDIRWQGKPPPKKIRKAAEAAIENDWQDDPDFEGAVKQTIPKMPGMWGKAQPGWEAMKLGNTGAEIFTFENDTTYD
jgi:hypothetical protein